MDSSVFILELCTIGDLCDSQCILTSTSYFLHLPANISNQIKSEHIPQHI